MTRDLDALPERTTSPLPRTRSETSPGRPDRTEDEAVTSSAPEARRQLGRGQLSEAELFAGYGLRLAELGGVPEVVHEKREVVHTSRTGKARIVDEREWKSRPRGRDSA